MFIVGGAILAMVNVKEGEAAARTAGGGSVISE
jgi:hypothetical protein